MKRRLHMKLHMVFLVVDDGFGNIWRTMNNQNTRDSIMMILKRKIEINWMVLIGLIGGGHSTGFWDFRR